MGIYSYVKMVIFYFILFFTENLTVKNIRWLVHFVVHFGASLDLC